MFYDWTFGAKGMACLLIWSSAGFFFAFRLFRRARGVQCGSGIIPVQRQDKGPNLIESWIQLRNSAAMGRTPDASRPQIASSIRRQRPPATPLHHLIKKSPPSFASSPVIQYVMSDVGKIYFNCKCT